MAVAVPIPPLPPVFEMPGPVDMRAPWDDLPNTTVMATHADSLGDVLRRASDVLGVRVTEEALRLHAEYGGQPRTADLVEWLVFVAFRRPDDEEELTLYNGEPFLKRSTRLKQTAVPVRDEAGLVTWREPPFEVTMAELLDAEDAQLVEGDVRQIYLLPVVPQGDFGVGDWGAFAIVLKVLWDAAEAIATAGGVVDFATYVREVVRRRRQGAPAVVERYATDWKARNMRPADLFQMLALGNRTSDEVAGLLGCEVNEAEAILWGFGFSLDEENAVWEPGGDEVARAIAGDLELAFDPRVGLRDPQLDLDQLVAERLKQLARTGKAAPIDDDLADRYEEKRRRWVREEGFVTDDPKAEE